MAPKNSDKAADKAVDKVADKAADKAEGETGKGNRLTHEDQFKFLISCIRHSSNGKVDFAGVAEECNVVSKGAAAKRYERLMKAHGIHHLQTGPPTPREATLKSTPRAKSTKSKNGSASKKRKLNSDDEEGEDGKRDTSTTPVKKEMDSSFGDSSPVNNDSSTSFSSPFQPINAVKQELKEED